MKKLVPGWVVNHKVVCIECIEKRPSTPWKLIQASECSNKANHRPKRKTG